MYPLIEIKTVPIEIQMKTKNASLEYTRGTAEMEISRSESGGVDIKSRPIKLQLDTFESRAAGTAPRVTPQSAAGLAQASYEATGVSAQQGALTLDAKVGQAYAGGTAANYLPTSGGTETQEGDMQIRYEMDKLNFDWKIGQGEFKFTPGDIEISVEQRPSVTIKYTGGPIYVPRSADPNYEPVDVKA